MPVTIDTPIDLSMPIIKKQFSDFIKYWLFQNSLTVEQLAVRTGYSTRTLRRYLPGPQRSVPKQIPMPTYYAILEALGKTHEDFYSSLRLTTTIDIEIYVDLDDDVLLPSRRKKLLKVLLDKAECCGKCIEARLDAGHVRNRILVSSTEVEMLVNREMELNDPMIELPEFA